MRENNQSISLIYSQAICDSRHHPSGGGGVLILMSWFLVATLTVVMDTERKMVIGYGHTLDTSGGLAAMLPVLITAEVMDGV